MVFPAVTYGCENWIIKKTEHQIIDALELWYWRSLLIVTGIARLFTLGDYQVKIFMSEKICPNKKQEHADSEDQLRHVVLEHIYFREFFFHLMPLYFELKHSCL